MRTWADKQQIVDLGKADANKVEVGNHDQSEGRAVIESSAVEGTTFLGDQSCKREVVRVGKSLKNGDSGENPVQKLLCRRPTEAGPRSIAGRKLDMMVVVRWMEGG